VVLIVNYLHYNQLCSIKLKLYLLQVDFDSQNINKTKCNCPIGLVGCCGHITGMLYQIANYKTLGLRALPEDVAKTSLPQTWHQPRGATIRGKAVQEVSVTGYSKTKNAVKEQPTIIKTTLYNPVKGQPTDWSSTPTACGP